MPKQDTYPLIASADSNTYATGYQVDPVSGKLTTIRVPMPFLYGGKWTMGVGAPTVNGAGDGDSYLNVQNGDVYTWSAAGGTWGVPKGTLINGTYQVPIWISGKPFNNEVLYSLEAPSTFIAAQGTSGSVAGADNPATALSVFSIQKNGVQIGTITYAAGSTVGVVNFPAQIIFLATDVLNVVAPSSVDATLSNIRMTLGFTRPSGAADSDIISSGQAANSATQAAASATAAAQSVTQASSYATTAQNWASQAAGTVDGTSYSAKYYALSISSAAATASSQASAAAGSATAAGNSATAAAGSATAAAGSATTSSTNATNAGNSATLAAAWASQTSGVVNGTAYNSAYFYAQQAAASATAAANSAATFPTTGRLIASRMLVGSGTYTPTAGTHSVRVRLLGGGAGSAGLPATSSTGSAVSAPGATGGYVEHLYTSGFSGLSYATGAAGVAGASGGGVGGNGGNTTFGTLVAGGGVGAGGVSTTNSQCAAGSGTGGSASGGNVINVAGSSAPTAFVSVGLGFGVGAGTWPSQYGGTSYGFGGGARGALSSTAAQPGFAGGIGFIIVDEYS